MLSEDSSISCAQEIHGNRVQTRSGLRDDCVLVARNRDSRFLARVSLIAVLALAQQLRRGWPGEVPAGPQPVNNLRNLASPARQPRLTAIAATVAENQCSRTAPP